MDGKGDTNDYNDGNNSDSNANDTQSGSGGNSISGVKRVSIYVGNLTWWTSDEDVLKAIAEIGVTDVHDVKFFENRANGQSKGFCVVNLGSESSGSTVIEKLPKMYVHITDTLSDSRSDHDNSLQ